MLESYVEKNQSLPGERLQILRDYLETCGDTPLAASLWMELAQRSQANGYFNQALKAYREAWRLLAGGTDEVTAPAEEALNGWLDLLARLGMRDELARLLKAIKNRAPHPLSESHRRRAAEILELWHRNPLASMECGVVAHNVVAVALGQRTITRYTQAPDPNEEVLLTWGLNLNEMQRAQLVSSGLSAEMLLRSIHTVNPTWAWVRRKEGDSIPAPCVIHLKPDGASGHYSGVTSVDAHRARVEDPLLGLRGWVDVRALNDSASGFFLVPDASALGSDFEVAGPAQLEQVFGRSSCPGGVDPEGCPKDKPKCGGMPVASFSRTVPGVAIHDQPLQYRPLYGPYPDLTVEYHQNNFSGDFTVTDTSHIGPGWKVSVYLFVCAINGNPVAGLDDLRVVDSSGYFDYGLAGAKKSPERPTISVLTPGYRLTFPDGSVVDLQRPNGPAPTRYYATAIKDPQGLQCSLQYDSQNRLSQIIDATGRVTLFNYSGTDTKIQSIEDPFGRVASFGYDVSGRLSSITDPAGIASSFTYMPTEVAKVSSMTTPYGTTKFEYGDHQPVNGSSVAYSDGWWISATDPAGFTQRVEWFYHDGFTAFTLGAQAEPRPPASILVGTSAVPFIPSVADPNGGYVGNHFHVTMSWDRKQWREYQNALATNPNADRTAFASMSLWLLQPGTGLSTSVPHAVHAPGTAASWFNYPGQASNFPAEGGSSHLPSKTAFQTENENGVVTWVMTQQDYNALGYPTLSKDERGRQKKLNYAANNQDVTTEQYWNGSAWVTIRTFGSYVNHLPGTVTEASGLITAYTYNAKNQVTIIDVKKGTQTEKTRYTYDTDGQGTPDGLPGYLMKVEQTSPASASQWVTTDTYTYDAFGRMETHSDATGYTKTYIYDALDRLVLVQYPDSTSEQYEYTTLDVTASKDRAGRWSRSAYNGIRKKAADMDPAGKISQYEWCSCGAMKKLIDPANRVTTWKRDILGRVTEKVMPDQTTKTTYTYEARSGRLASMTRPNEQGGSSPTVSYRYHIDGRLRKEDYSDPGTPDVTYHYTTTLTGSTLEPLGRLTFVQDGIGQYNFAYVAYTSTASTAGEGKLSGVDGPIVNDDIIFSYDWRDRPYRNIVRSDAGTNLRLEDRTWDSLGRPKTVVNAIGTHTFGYLTPLRRPDTLTAPNTLVTSFTYFENNVPFNLAQRLWSITHQRGAVEIGYHDYNYNLDSSGQMTKWEQRASGLPNWYWWYSHNRSDELTSAIRFDHTSQSVDEQTWALDNAGNWLSHTTTDANTGAAMETRTHDIMNRLTQRGGSGSTVVEGHLNEFATVTVNGQPAEVKGFWGMWGNGGYRFRRVVPVTEGVNSFNVTATDPNNETTSQNYEFSVSGVTHTLTYDANGNMLSDGSGTRSFVWDAKNRLKKVIVGATTYEWDYDYRDRRVKEFAYATGAAKPVIPAKIFIWIGNDLVQERTGTAANTGTLSRNHFFGGFADGTTVANSVKYQTTTDHLGNVRDVLTTTGTLAARYDYTPYQKPIRVGTHTVDASLLTIGRYYHHEASGLELALYRAYDGDLGRWISEDPIEERGGLNLYEYVGSSPVASVDELGLDTLIGWVPMGGVLVPLSSKGNVVPGSGGNSQNCFGYATGGGDDREVPLWPEKLKKRGCSKVDCSKACPAGFYKVLIITGKGGLDPHVYRRDPEGWSCKYGNLPIATGIPDPYADYEQVYRWQQAGQQATCYCCPSK